MSMNLSAKLDELQRGDRQLETTVALCEIRTQLQELTKSVESCQSEVSEVKRDMVAIKVLLVSTFNEISRNLPISDRTRRMSIDFSILVIEGKQRKRYSEKKEFVSCFVLHTRMKMSSLKKGYFVLNRCNVRAC